MTKFCLIAHRGYSAEAPENTFAAFDLAIEKGFLHIETDVQLCSSGEPVVFHDKELERHTDGHGLLADTTLEALQLLDAGSWFGTGGRYCGEHMPTLRQLLQRYTARGGGPSIHLHLELKSPQPLLPETVARELRLAGWVAGDTGNGSQLAASSPPPSPSSVPAAPAPAAKLQRQQQGSIVSGSKLIGAGVGAWEVPGLTLTSFHYEQLERSLQLLPHVRHGWLVPCMSEDVLRQAKVAGIHGVYPLAARVDHSAVQRALDAGHMVRGWGVKTEQDLLRLVHAGAQGSTVDWPTKAAGVLQKLVAAAADNSQ